ncbi:NADH-quinone oxidoreductase subunit A [Gordonia sp. Z-3]|uniref:NADH-quinone oxidoreductase subunit n=2 Tax=Gordonia TaxID=2053 RepID=A0A9X3I3H3_9ACTN|nr:MULTISPECIES: NADH-quinone oxidoreductase subunit A [Gordonia]MAU81302.1 NADH-quinone oxidoreductase subunit I [Gordonia sp. (in: high G+C Gram-positive bacteria)]MCF3938171.1 NADH-quinone oxidoreductase subunit A [Gordonia tangerina]MCX2963613.1 NADH-quinone oxidoreductase subunit A [Gordonia aquimaris]MED5803559.1 NADH-quinone oxidoreductase subunit A [Gordonia sp. Z-3]
MYAGVGAMLTVALGVIVAVLALHRLTAVARSSLTVMPFQSGWAPAEHALSRYHARWYPVTLLFLAFDVEMLFMYPWAVVVADLGMSAVIEMFVFLAALFVVVAWAWREGVLRWA